MTFQLGQTGSELVAAITQVATAHGVSAQAGGVHMGGPTWSFSVTFTHHTNKVTRVNVWADTGPTLSVGRAILEMMNMSHGVSPQAPDDAYTPIHWRNRSEFRSCRQHSRLLTKILGDDGYRDLLAVYGLDQPRFHPTDERTQEGTTEG